MQRLVILPMLAGLLLAGSQAPARDVEYVSSFSTSDAVPTASPQDQIGRLDDVRQGREGIDYTEVRRRHQSTSSGLSTRVDLAFDARARSLTALVTASEGETSPERLVVVSREGKTLRQVARVGSKRAPAQVLSGVLTRHWAVWKQTTSFDLATDDWTMWSENLDTGRKVRLASAEPPHGTRQPAAPGDTVPSVSRGTVIFSSVRMGASGQPYVAVLGVPLGGGQVRQIARGSGATASAGHLYWETDAAHGFRIHDRDLDTGSTSTVFGSAQHGCDKIEGLTASGSPRSVSWLTTCHGEHRWYLDSLGTLQVYRSSHPLGYLSSGDGFAWAAAQTSSGYRQFVVSTQHPDDAFRLGGGGHVSGAASVGGRWFEWRSFGPGAVVAHLARLGRHETR